MANETTLNDIMEAIVGLNQKMDSGFERLDKKIDNKVDGLRNEMNLRFEEVNVRFQEQDMRLDLIESKLDQVGVNRILVLEREVEVIKANLKKALDAVAQLQEAK